MVAKTVQLVLRVEQELADALDELGAQLAGSTGVEITRTAVARAAMLKGVEVMRAEMKAKRPKR